MNWSGRQAVELFHLAFLVQLGTRLGKDRFVIKGGCNLRFFFNSVRYSEDLDIDVGNVARPTLKQAMNRVLSGQPLRHTLGAAGVSLVRTTEPKQTDVTQRWKIALEASGVGCHTKVEFSRRGISDPTVFGQASPTLTGRYGLTPLLSTHYTREAAIRQKLGALVGRAETQARDLFDLNLLIQGDAKVAITLAPGERKRAIDRALSLDFDAFKAQVVAFLEPELQEQYSAPAVWDAMVLRVVEALGGPK